MNSEDVGNNDGDIDLTIIVQIRILFLSFDNYHLFDHYCNDLVNHSIPVVGNYYHLFDNYHLTIIVKM